MKHFDAIIIGAGQAGVPLAKKLAEAGKKTAIIEKRLIGGTCINDGCTPTKAMVASARIAHQARQATHLGIDIGQITVNFPKIKKRKDEITASFRASAQKGLEETKNLELIFGEASFTAEKELNVTMKTGEILKFSADLIFINTGAWPIIPAVEGLQAIDFLTSTTILDLEVIPEHLVILGGNYIGLEFGQMFSRFGSKITIIERSSRLLKREDKDVSDEVLKFLQEENIEVLTETQATKIGRGETGKITIQLDCKGEKANISCSHVLVATGRKPQTHSLNLDLAGVLIDEAGNILVNDKLETNIPGVYALGDVKGGPAFTHIAYNDYTIVYRNLMFGSDYTINDRPVPYCMFTDPQLGRIGLSEQEAVANGLNIKVVTMPMSQVARGIETGETKGLMKAVVDADTGKILGAVVLAAEGGEIISILEMAMEGGITYDRIRYFVFAHPTYAESLNNLFMKLED